MKRFVLFILVMSTAAAVRADGEDTWAAWPYRLHLRVVSPQISDDVGMAQVEVNLGPAAAQDRRDVIVVDKNGYERPWYLRSSTASGDSRIVFETVKGTTDYMLLFGKAEAKRPSYGKRWSIGRVVIDDFLPRRAYIHGLWSWVKTPTLSGEYAHTNPITDRFNYHGTSEIRNYALYESSVIHQYVMLDKEKTPEQIVIRLVYEQRPGANSWDQKHYVNCYWGERKIRDIGGQFASTVKMGKLPEAGKWTRLTISMKDLLRKVRFSWKGGGLPDLFGLEFCTDKGRAHWDLTTLGNVPVPVDIVAFERKDPKAKPTFVTQRLRTFKLNKTGKTLNEVRLIPTLAPGATCTWEFGDGTTSTDARPVHLFEGEGDAAVKLTVDDDTPPAEGPVRLDGTRRTLAFAIDLVSLPFIVRADDKALFNLRLEGNLKRRMDVTLQATLLDASGKTIRREPTSVTMFPGKKHPTFRAFSLDVGDEDLARIRFRLLLHGRLLAERDVMVYSSRSDLSDLVLSGDRYLDKFKRPAVIRCEVKRDAAAKPSWTGLPQRTVVIGDVPTGKTPIEDRLRKALAAADTRLLNAKVNRTGVKPLPAWSMPFRQVIEVSPRDVGKNTDVVVIASAVEMMLAGVPARTGADAISVVIDQVRRRSDAEIVLLTPTVYSELEDLARQYTVLLRMLGIEKDVRVIDVYSRSLQLGGKTPELLKTEKITDGFLVHDLHPVMIEMIVSTIVRELKSTPRVISVSP